MADSTGPVLAAAAIVAANDALFTSPPDYTAVWRVVPVAAFLALGLMGLEQISPAFAVGLSRLLVVAVLVVPVGNAPTPLENASKLVSGISTKKGG